MSSVELEESRDADSLVAGVVDDPLDVEVVL